MLRRYGKETEDMPEYNLEENLRYSMAKRKETIDSLNTKISELSKNVEVLKEERKRLDEELAPKRKELAELNRKIFGAKRQHELLAKEYDELKVLVYELQRRRNKYVEDIANYEMEYGKYMNMLNRVIAKLDGRELKVKELRDLIIETLEDEACKMANSILAEWIREGFIIPIGEFTINITCPHCFKTSPLPITRDFMARLVRSSTTIQCTLCGGIIEITYEYVVGELSKTIKQKQ